MRYLYLFCSDFFPSNEKYIVYGCCTSCVQDEEAGYSMVEWESPQRNWRQNRKILAIASLCCNHKIDSGNRLQWARAIKNHRKNYE